MTSPHELSPIQFEDRYPNLPVVSELRQDACDFIVTPNGNKLTVTTDWAQVEIADYRVRVDYKGTSLPLYLFEATCTEPGVMNATIRRRGPHDWPEDRKHPDIRPVEQLQQAMDYFAVTDSEIYKFDARWDKDHPLFNTNALAFSRVVEDPANSNISPTELTDLAVRSTPTGKIMEQLGFTPDLNTFKRQLYNDLITVSFLRNNY